MSELRSLPSVAGNTRKWVDVTCERTLVSAAPAVLVCVGERERHLNTRGFCTVLFTFFEILLSANNMSVLCYNKGCGQRFDPENNPDGE